MVTQTQAAKVYTNDVIKHITAKYLASSTPETVKELAKELEVSDRSVIAKLSSLGIYVKKSYLNKQGEVPIPKNEYIDRISKLLDIDPSIMDSMENVTKMCLVLMEKRIKELIEEGELK